MARDNETHVVMKRGVINPDSQEPALNVGDIRHLNDVVRICEILGVDHVDAWICGSREVAEYVAANYFDTSTNYCILECVDGSVRIEDRIHNNGGWRLSKKYTYQQVMDMITARGTV